MAFNRFYVGSDDFVEEAWNWRSLKQHLENDHKYIGYEFNDNENMLWDADRVN